MQSAIFTKVFGDRPLADAVELAADIGYDAVELMGRAPHFGPDTTIEEARALRRRLDDLGLDVAGIASYTGKYLDIDEAEREATLADFEHFVELADIVGTDLVRHGPGGPPERAATDDDYDLAAEWLGRAADVAADHDTRLGIEIHADTIVETAPGVMELIDRIDRSNVGAIHDAGNMYVVAAEYGRSTLETLGDRLFHVHVKDLRRVADSGPATFTRETPRGTETIEHALLGRGDVDHWSLVAALEDRGYAGYLTDECHRPTDDEWTDEAIAAHELAELERLLTTAT